MTDKKGRLCIDWICPLRKPNNKIVFGIINGKKSSETNMYCTSIDCKKPLEEVREKLEIGYKEFGKEFGKELERINK